MDKGIKKPLQSKQLMIGLPIYRSVSPAFLENYMNFVSALQDETKVQPIGIMKKSGDSLVSRQRNGMVACFLEHKEFTHYLQIDSDLYFNLEHVTTILDDMDKVDICSGLYPFKTPYGKVDFVLNRLDKGEHQDVIDEQLFQIKYAGTGFLCVARKVFEDIIEKFRDEIEYTVDNSKKTEHDIFRVGVCKFGDGSRRYLSEDYYFCEMARRCGYKVYVDGRLLLRHEGEIVYPTPQQEYHMNNSGNLVEKGRKPEANNCDNGILQS